MIANKFLKNESKLFNNYFYPIISKISVFAIILRLKLFEFFIKGIKFAFNVYLFEKNMTFSYTMTP
jgi:hypothetical protein